MRLKESELAELNLRYNSLWQKTKSLMKEKVSIPPLRHGNRWLSSSKEKADAFGMALAEQFQPNPPNCQENEDHVTQTLSEPLQLSPLKFFFSLNQVHKLIKGMPKKKSPGFDSITKQLLIYMPRKTLVLLTQIFDASLRLGYFPKAWKRAKIIMIHKKGKPTDNVASYRPISLLSLLSKLFEKLLYPHILSQVEQLLPSTQFGFRDVHSCPLQLHRVVDKILETYENKKITIGMFLDVEKAFDRVWHQGLLAKLKPHLSDTLYRVVQSFLSERTFRVSLGDELSPQHGIQASVPQGSVLGPLLYIIYAHDVPQTPATLATQFADDMAVLADGATGEEAALKLQVAADAITKWAEQWRIKLNPTKTVLVVFTYRKKYNIPSITLCRAPVERKDSVTYLGLTLDSRLTWSSHISNTVAKIRTRVRQLAPILTSNSLTLDLKLIIYKTAIKPIWLYGAEMWNSASKSQLKRIQTTQNRVFRLITQAPWYIRNTALHSDLEEPTIVDSLTAAYYALFKKTTTHPNPNISAIQNQRPPPRVRCRLKRKHHMDLADGFN